MNGVDCVLHLLVVAVAHDIDRLLKVSDGNLRKDAVALGDRKQDGVEHLVGALDDLAVSARERAGVAALLELTLARVLGQLRKFCLEFLQHRSDAVDVLLHLLMIALVGLRDQFVDLALGDLVEDAVALADRQQDGVEHLVGALDDLAVGARERAGVAALFELTLARVLGQFTNSALNFCNTKAMPLTFCFIFS